MARRSQALLYLTLTTILAGMAFSAFGQTPPPPPTKPAAAAPPTANLADFKTVETAVAAKLAAVKAEAAGQPGYLGIVAGADKLRRLVVSEVEAGSPAAKAGLESGDVLLKAGGKAFHTEDELRDWLRSLAPGAAVKFQVERKHKPVEVAATLGAPSRPRKLLEERAILGIQVAEGTDEGARVTRVVRGSPAEAAGVLPSDMLVKVDGAAVTEALRLDDSVGEKQPGQEMVLTVRRGGKDLDIRVTLASSQAAGGQIDPGNDRRPRFSRDVYRLAVIPIEYPDVKHNPDVKTADWDASLYSKGTYTNKISATGQPVYGSLNDYYQEQSCGKLRVEGKFFDWVEVSKNRADYSVAAGGRSTARTAVLTEALDKIEARDGASALEGFDGVMFLYAGGRFATNRGGIYWPHRSTIAHRGKRRPYLIVPEGGARMLNISVVCHEFGHMLGLPDLYARPENPGSEGLGNWCVMSNQVGNGRPQHMGAWCKERMGWLQPTVIDPTVKQKLVLSPIEQSPRECFKVLVRADGSEYLLLENRRKTGFDASLPAEGLLIWRVVGNRPILEEAHGVAGPSGPRVFPASVPFPSPENSAFTPETTPSSRSQLGGGLPVYLTNIQRLPDGRISFYVGYAFD